MIRSLGLNETEAQVRDMVAGRLASLLNGIEGSGNLSGAAFQALAELGVLAVPLPEVLGGMGEGLGNAALVLEPLGQQALVTSYLESVCVPAAIAEFYPAFARLQASLEMAASGKAGAVMAWMEKGQGWNRTPRLTSAVRSGANWVLSGHKTLVRCGDLASAFLLTANVNGAPALFWLPVNTKGVGVTSYHAADGRGLVDIELDGVVLAPECRIDDGNAEAAIDYGVDAGSALSLCEAVGLMNRSLELTVDYLKTREQFGNPLSKMQALQHRMVDMYAHVECAWSLAHDAACCLSMKTPVSIRHATVSKAKAYVGRTGRRVAQEALQMHGAIGMTKEYPLGSYLQRLTAIDLDYGDSNWHIRRLECALQGDEA